MPAEQHLESAALQAQISELEDDLKTQLADKTQELSTSDERVAELEKKLKEAQTANVKTVHGLKNQLDQKTKEMSIYRGRFLDVEKGLNEALAASQANVKIAEEAMAASQKLEDKIKDLISQVLGLKGALAIDQQANARVAELEKLLAEKAEKLRQSNADLLQAQEPVKKVQADHQQADDQVTELKRQLIEQQCADKLVEKLQARLTAEYGDVDMELDINSHIMDGDVDGNGTDLDPFQDEADDILSLPILEDTYKEKAPEQSSMSQLQEIPDYNTVASSLPWVNLVYVD